MTTRTQTIATALKRADADLVFLSADTDSEPAPSVGARPDGYLHAVNDPAKHIKRSSRPRPVRFDSTTEALSVLAAHGYITTQVRNLSPGKSDSHVAYRDTAAGVAAYESFMAALEAQGAALAAHDAHLAAVKARRERIEDCLDRGIPRRMLAAAYGRLDSQVANMVSPPARGGKSSRLDG